MFWTGLDERKLRPVLGRDSSCATSPTLYLSFYHCIVSSGFMGHWNVPRSDCRVICASQQCINETAVHDRIEMKISWSASVLLHCIVVESEWRFCTFFVVSALKEPWLRNANDLWLAWYSSYWVLLPLNSFRSSLFSWSQQGCWWGYRDPLIGWVSRVDQAVGETAHGFWHMEMENERW